MVMEKSWNQKLNPEMCKKTALASTVPHSQSSSSCSKQAIQAIPVRLEYCFPSAGNKAHLCFYLFNIDSEHSLLFYCLRLSSWDKQTAFMTVQNLADVHLPVLGGQILVYAGWGWWHLPRRFHLKLEMAEKPCFLLVSHSTERCSATAVWWQPDWSQSHPGGRSCPLVSMGTVDSWGYSHQFQVGRSHRCSFSANSEAINRLTLLPHSAGKCNRPREANSRQRLKTLSPHLRSCSFFLSISIPFF